MSLTNNPTINDSNQEELSLAEKILGILQIDQFSPFKPTFFTNKELSELSKTSRILYCLAKPELDARKLLSHVVLGEQDKAKAMIKANPKLLLIRTKAVDYSGRTIIGTAFQGALGAGDKPMWNMMLPYLESLEKGEALRQFHEQFPNGIEDDVLAEQLKDYYNALALAIINHADHGQSAIEEFRQGITSQKEIEQGKHFNLQHLLAAYQAYIDNFDALTTWDNRDLFWKKVIGYVQRQMTAYDAQVHCSGVKSVLDNENAFKRLFGFCNGGEFFPLSVDSGLGFDFGCYSVAGRYAVALLGLTLSLLASAAWVGRGLLKSYVERKQMCLLDLESHLSKECTISPVNYS